MAYKLFNYLNKHELLLILNYMKLFNYSYE